jgi:hypothetical protein
MALAPSLVSFDNRLKLKSVRPPHTVETIVGPCSFAIKAPLAARVVVTANATNWFSHYVQPLRTATPPSPSTRPARPARLARPALGVVIVVEIVVVGEDLQKVIGLCYRHRDN